MLQLPALPANLGELRIHNLTAGAATVDRLLAGHEQYVGVSVLCRDEDARIVAAK